MSNFHISSKDNLPTYLKNNISYFHIIIMAHTRKCEQLEVVYLYQLKGIMT